MTVGSLHIIVGSFARSVTVFGAVDAAETTRIVDTVQMMMHQNDLLLLGNAFFLLRILLRISHV